MKREKTSLSPFTVVLAIVIVINSYFIAKQELEINEFNRVANVGLNALCLLNNDIDAIGLLLDTRLRHFDETAQDVTKAIKDYLARKKK